MILSATCRHRGQLCESNVAVRGVHTVRTHFVTDSMMQNKNLARVFAVHWGRRLWSDCGINAELLLDCAAQCLDLCLRLVFAPRKRSAA